MVIAIDTRQHYIVDTPSRDRFCCVKWFRCVGWCGLGGRVDGAEFASSCARVAKKHDCSCSTVPAFSDVWALCFFTYGMQIELFQGRLCDLRVQSSANQSRNTTVEY